MQDYQLLVPEQHVALQVRFHPEEDYHQVEPERVVVMPRGWQGKHFEVGDLGYV